MRVSTTHTPFNLDKTLQAKLDLLWSLFFLSSLQTAASAFIYNFHSLDLPNNNN